MREEDVPAFLDLPFDWFVLERWNNGSPESKRQQHIRLGIEFARLGHEGRRPYVVLGLDRHNQNPGPPKPPRSPSEVPHDLLTPQERWTQIVIGRTWLRTDYSAGTDERHRESIDGFDDDISTVLGDRSNLFDDSTRYSFDDVSEIYAFFPGLLTCIKGEYLDWDVYAYDSEEVQESLFPSFMSEPLRSRVAIRDVFIADREAMRTGFLLWLQPDQYGRTLLWNRIQPWSLREATLRDGEWVRDGHGDGVIEEFGERVGERVVGVWEPLGG